jgi:hypothetical protein
MGKVVMNKVGQAVTNEVAAGKSPWYKWRQDITAGISLFRGYRELAEG